MPKFVTLECWNHSIFTGNTVAVTCNLVLKPTWGSVKTRADKNQKMFKIFQKAWKKLQTSQNLRVFSERFSSVAKKGGGGLHRGLMGGRGLGNSGVGVGVIARGPNGRGVNSGGVFNL